MLENYIYNKANFRAVFHGSHIVIFMLSLSLRLVEITRYYTLFFGGDIV